MKKTILGTLLVLVLVSTFLWWQQHKQDKEFMESLLLHQSLDIDNVQNISGWKPNEEHINIPKGEGKEIVEWFNRHPSNMVAERNSSDYPTPEARISIKLKSGDEVIIHYIQGSIFVSRTDVKGGMKIIYKFSEDASMMEGYSKLKNYFKQLITQ